MRARAPGLFARAMRRPEQPVAVALACCLLAGFAGLVAADTRPFVANLAGLALGQVPAAFDQSDPPALLGFAALMIPTLELALILAIVWTVLRQPVLLRLMRLRGDHLVIAGNGDLARIAAGQGLDRGSAVLLWLDDRRLPWVRSALHRGAVRVRCGDPAQTVAELGLANARSVLLLCDAANDNAGLAGLVLQAAARMRPAGDPLAVIARIDDPSVRAALDAKGDLASKAIARLRITSLAALAARRLFLDWPIDRFRRADAAGRCIVTFGFSPIIDAYVSRILAGSHFRDGVRPRFVIAVADPDFVRERFHACHRDADARSRTVFEKTDFAQAERAMAEIAAHHGDPVAVLVDAGDAATTRGIADAVDRYYRSQDRATPLIHLHANRDGPAPDCAMAHSFGGLDDFNDPDFLTQERHDALARSIHDFYLEGCLSAGEPIGARASLQEWENLPESFRDDNRLVADCYQLKLRDIGARIITEGGPPLRFEPDELEALAIAEHDRWMAAKLSDGWVYGPQRDDRRRLHPDIVPYAALSERVKDLDREQVRVMTRLLAASGVRALRVLTVAIEPAPEGGPPAGLAAGLPEALAAIAVNWPDRVVILAGSLSDAATRSALASAGERVRLVVPGHAGRLIDSLDPPERDRARDLMARADSVVAVAAEPAVRAAVLAGADLVLAGEATGTLPIPTVRFAADGRIRSAPWLG